jgi:hypothetical protein
MPKLENPKHEEFALHLARGMKQGKAYELAGYQKNPSAASKLAAMIVIEDRVVELREELHAEAEKALILPDGEVVQSLTEMGLTLPWVAAQYKAVYKKAMDVMLLPAANTALQNIQKMIEAESAGKKGKEEDTGPKINMSDMLSVLDKVGDIIKASKDTPAIPGDDARVINEDMLNALVPVEVGQ